jgi:hypothetical protein
VQIRRGGACCAPRRTYLERRFARIAVFFLRFEHAPRRADLGTNGKHSGFSEHLDSIVTKHHDVFVRTTLTLDPDVERLLADASHRERRSFKEVVNDAIRRGLSAEGVRKSPRPKLPPAHVTTLMPGIEISRLNALADQLDTEAFTAKQRRK